MMAPNEQPDPLQGHTREWPSTPYSDEVRAPILLRTMCAVSLWLAIARCPVCGGHRQAVRFAESY